MRLIEAIVMAQQTFGSKYGDWKAIHGGTGCVIGHAPRGVYLAFDMNMIAQSLDCLEVVLAAFAERYPAELLDDQWKISRWD